MQNLGDAYMVNGWEAMPYDNHSGIVDIYRNPKGDASILAYYNQPLYVAVASRNQVVKLPGSAIVDFYIVNEKNLKGNHILEIKVIAPDGKVVYTRNEKVSIEGVICSKGSRYSVHRYIKKIWIRKIPNE